MVNVKELIIETLKQKLEYKDDDGNNQWILGISIARRSNENKIENTNTYIARAVTRNTASNFTDGIEISFIILDDEIIEYSNINNFPIFHGSTLVDNIRWLNGLGDIYYFQRENPFDKEDDNCDY